MTTKRTCPRCGRKGTDYAETLAAVRRVGDEAKARELWADVLVCRDVPKGYWCKAVGLVGTLPPIAATPDPISEAVRNDPRVIETTAARDQAQSAYDAAEVAWKDLLGKLASLRLSPRGGMLVNGGGPASIPSRERRRAEKLEAAEDEAREALEDAGEQLRRAKRAHHTATVAARRDATAAALPASG